MTVSSSVNKVTYAGNGTTTVFSANFYFFQDSDLLVVLRDANGIETVKTLTTDYTVTGAGNISGGSVTMLVAPAAGETLVIAREVALTQQTDYLANDPFPAETHERALDKLTMAVQQIQEQVDRSAKLPISDPASAESLVADLVRVADSINQVDTVANNITSVNTTATNIANVNTVAGISGNVTTVAGISANVTTVAGINANVTTVAGIAPNVTTVAGIASNVTTVATNNANVTTVATNLSGTNTIGTVATDITNVNLVGGSITNVNTVAGEVGVGGDVTVVAADLAGVDNVGTVAGSITNVNAVGGSITNVNAVAGELGVGGDVTVVAADLVGVDNIGTVAGSITNVNATGGSIASVNTVASNVTNVNTVAGISANVTTVAGIAPNVTTVANNNTNVTTVATNLTGTNTIGTVATNIANVNAVGTNIANVNTVAGNNANITTVAGISGNVTTVANNNTNVTTVATNISAINTNATNILAIQTASSNATAAANSATAAANSATQAGTFANTALTHAQSAAAATNAPVWVSGTAYIVGSLVYSPINGKIYRSKSAFTSTTDPSADATNWTEMLQVVDQSDIGTAPNEIPLNQHLGSMAYQSLENVIVENLTVTGQLNARQEVLVGSFQYDFGTPTPDSVFGRQQIVTGVHDKIRGCVLNANGTVNYYLADDNWSLKADGTSSVLTGADGNVMVEIPKFYYRVEQNVLRRTWKISAVAQSGFKVHPAFIKDGVEVDFRYYGAYDACYLDDTDSTYKSGLNLDDMTANLDLAADKLASVKGVYPLVGVTRDEVRSLAANVGTGWRQLDFTLWSAVQMLYLIEYQSFYSQDILGAGNTAGSYLTSSATQSDSPHTIAGAGDSLGAGSTNTVTGAGVSAKPGTSFMKYRGIENFYGNCWNWADGINVNVGATGNVHVTNNRADFADNTSTNMTLIATAVPTASGFIRDFLPVDGYFLSSSNSGGSSTTYITDQHFASATSNRGVIVGGRANDGASAGAFCLNLDAASSIQLRNVGGRLAF